VVSSLNWPSAWCLPLMIFSWAIVNQRVGVVRAAAFLTIFGIVLNRLNTAMIAFNWQLYREIPHIFEVIITITVFAIYIVVSPLSSSTDCRSCFTWKTVEGRSLRYCGRKCPSQCTSAGLGAGNWSRLPHYRLKSDRGGTFGRSRPCRARKEVQLCSTVSIAAPSSRSPVP